LSQRLQQLEEGARLHFGGVAEVGLEVEVEQWRHRSEHLQNERLSVKNVELLADELNGATEESVRLVVRVNAANGGHNQEIAVGREDVAELMRGVDIRGHTKTHHRRVLAVKNESAVHDVQEEMDVRRLHEEAVRGVEHSRHEFDPNDLVESVHSQHFLTRGARIEAEVGFEGFARKRRQFHELFVQKENSLNAEE
jgi:hypothetical protein